MKKIIHAVFEDVVKRFNDKICIVENNREISYGNLSAYANKIAHVLNQSIDGHNNIIGVFMPSGIDLVGSMLGIFKSGNIYLPINIDSPAHKISHICTECDPGIYVVPKTSLQEIKDKLNQLNISWNYLLVLDGESQIELYKQQGSDLEKKSIEGISENAPAVLSDPDDGNYIFYTSGSTGEPKAIMGCHKSLTHFINWEIEEFDVTSDCRVSQLAPVTFDASLRDIFVPLCTGGTLFIPAEEDRYNVSRLIDWLAQNGITIMHTVPSMLRLINAELGKDGVDAQEIFKDLQYFFLSGEKLFGKDILKWQSAVGNQVNIVNLYGATETTMIKTFYRVKGSPKTPGQLIPVGKPMSNTLVAVINDGMICKPGEIGEVFIKTPFITKGYPFDKELQARVFVQNPLQNEREEIVYKTGDLGKVLENGDLEILGRNDNQVKVNGIRVELNEIENAIQSIEGVEESVALLHTNKDNQASLVCYYTSETLSPDDLKAALTERIERAVVPHWILKLDELPLNINGKVDRKALAKKELILDASEYHAPQGEEELRLESIWKEVLHLSQVSRDVSFFSIGGTSLKAIQVISRVSKEFNVLLKIGDIFDYQSIAQLAQLIIASSKSVHRQIMPIATKEFYDVTYAQKRLWIVDQLQEGQIAYNMPSAYKISGTLERDVFQEALKKVVEKHEILRTTFVAVDGHPMQKVHDVTEFEISITEIDITTHPDQQNKIQEIADEYWNQPFDLKKGPLFRAIMIVLSESEFVFLVNMHHIISDGWSMDILASEVFNCYEYLKYGGESFVSTLRIQYKDFADWENQQLAEENANGHHQFWLDQFEGDIPVLNIPFAKERPLLATFNGENVVFNIDENSVLKIKELLKACDVTLFIFLMTLVKMLLYRHSGQHDLVVGMPVANRDHKDLENQVGLYVNTLAIRTQLDTKMSFENLLQKVKSTMVEAHKHSIYPIDLLVEELELPYNQSRNSLFDVMVQIQDTADSVNSARFMESLEIEKLHLKPPSSKFDFTFNFLEDNGQLEVGIEYNTDIYEAAFVEKLKSDIISLVQMVLDDKSSSLHDLRYSLLDDHEINQSEYYQKQVSSEISDGY